MEGNFWKTTNMVYQFNANMLPDALFHPGTIKYIVPGNEGRLLDGRRTPVRLLEIKHETGVFVVEILDFEDKGARWEMPFERVNRFQFAKESKEASNVDIEYYRKTIARLDQPLTIPANDLDREQAESTITSLRKSVKDWLVVESQFIKSGTQLKLLAQTGNSHLWKDIEAYMRAERLWDIERAFAKQFVSNPNSGELVKGHRIVLAELGFVAFEGKKIRDTGLFHGIWDKEQRAKHILHRLAFVRELFALLGKSSVILYRGLSSQGQPDAIRNKSFVSATFNVDIAMSHFKGRDETNTGILLRQSVPVERIFMSFLETAQLNQQFKEAEAILLYEDGNKVF